MTPMKTKFTPQTILLITIITIGILSGLFWLQYEASKIYRDQLTAAVNELNTKADSALTAEKTRQEAVKLRLENEQHAVFMQSLFSTLTASVGVLVALSGIWMAFAQYMAAKERERLDRASKDLENLWEGISMSRSVEAQAAAIATLQHFLSPDKQEYHGRVAAALALVGRMKERPKLVEETFKPIVEKAMRSITGSMGEVSWQGANLKGVDFSDLDLSGFDFRDSKLTEVDFSRSKLNKTRFDAAKLIRSSFEGAELHGANLVYADLADSNFRHAELKNADISHVWLKNADFYKTQLQHAKITHFDTDFRFSRAWRSAAFSDGILQQLIEKYGPPVEGPRVLMLVWEFVPKVSGGLWTAVYHFLRNLRARGADLTVAIPLSSKEIDFEEFGNEIRVLPLGGDSVNTAGKYTSYDAPEPDNNSQRRQSSSYQFYNSGMIDNVLWFSNVLLEAIEQQGLAFDVVHAHDWITFPAAQAVSDQLKIPWIAHMHSTEEDRRPGKANGEIVRYEIEACRRATAIITPSEVTRQRLVDLYSVNSEQIDVVPNCLSEQVPALKVQANGFHAKTVAFIGRLTSQKGPDYFVETARILKFEKGMPYSFVVYGDGDMLGTLRYGAKVETKTETHYPEPVKIAPTQKDTIQRICASFRIVQIAPAEYNPNTKVARAHRSVQEEEMKKLVDYVLSRGFTAHALDSDEFSHAIKLDGEVPDNVSTWYCIDADGLPVVEKRSTGGWSFVEFNGELPWTQRYKAFHDVSVVVLPSRHEPFGMVVLEAMQSGVPVIFDSRAGVGEVVSAGVKVDCGDTRALASEIEALLESEHTWKACADKALAEINDYPNRGYEKALMDIWRRLVSQSAG
jgi:glycosyltransferase involved in cell wall biosynthesis